MSSFSGHHIECPDCKVADRRWNPMLFVVDKNYSGTSVDYGACPECGHAFSVSYAVAEVRRDAAWDCPARADMEAAEAAEKRQAIEAEKAEYERLKAKFT